MNANDGLKAYVEEIVEQKTGLAEIRALTLEDLAAQLRRIESALLALARPHQANLDMVVIFPGHLRGEAAEYIQRVLNAKFPDRRTLVLGDGARLEKPGQLDSIEKKLDTLIKALAEEEESGPVEDLDGKKHATPEPRPETRGL